MATNNIAITSAWTKLAETADADVLITCNDAVTVEVAATLADAAPTVVGHKLNPGQAITRSLIGSGYVWAKLLPGSQPASVIMVVSK
jgi:hypothetical protein